MGGKSPTSGKLGLPLVFRGTRIGRRELARIRQLVRRQPFLTRTEIARRICRMFDWQGPSGVPAVRSCAAFLGRLERHGLIRLPASRRQSAGRSQARSAYVDLRVSEAPVFRGASPGGEGLVVRPLDAGERQGFRWYMERCHYLGWCRPTGESLLYVALLDGSPVALLGWASATLKNTPRDKFLGWDAECKRRRLHMVTNNYRFLMLPDAPHGLASRVLAKNLHRLRRDWEMTHGHPVYLAETFVDRSRFKGTCYRASNWVCLGETTGYSRKGSSWIRNDCPKTVFVYLLHRHARRWLGEEESPVDSGEGRESPMQRLDVSKLPLHGQGGLLELLETIEDPRDRRGIRHPLRAVLAVAVAAMLSGVRSVTAMAEFGQMLSFDVLEKLGCRYFGAPSEPTLRRVLSHINAEEFDRKLGQWILERAEDLVQPGISLDGKTLRGSGDGEVPAVHLLSAVLHREGLVLNQTRVESKTNELKCVAPVLDPLDIQGAVVTGDAMFTQKEVAEYLVSEKKADYILQVKDNQPTLLDDIKDLRLEAFPPSGRNDGEGTRADRDEADLDE